MANGEWLVLIVYYMGKPKLIARNTQTHEVIGSPPNVAVPTHFAKVVLATKPTSQGKSNLLELAQGAFVLPNTTIPDDAPLESFAMPGKQELCFHIAFNDVL
jgi:endonuclease G